MICLLNCLHEAEDRVRVGAIHYKPERLTVEARASGMMVETTEADLPQPKPPKRTVPVLYFNPKTRDFWYEYANRPATQEELLADVVARLDTVISLLGAQATRS